MNVDTPILAPAVALVLWSLVMLGWLALTRLPAMSRAGIALGSIVGGRGADLEKVLPATVNWKSHNYTHLMEQPTLFYATAIILALVGAGAGVNAQLAWAYVVLRIAHSLVQALWNRVAVRFALFGASSLVLAVLAVNAALAVF